MAEEAQHSTRPQSHPAAARSSAHVVSTAGRGGAATSTLSTIASSVSNLAVTEPPTSDHLLSDQDMCCCPPKKIRMMSDDGDRAGGSLQHCDLQPEMERCCDRGGGRRGRHSEEKSLKGAGHLCGVRPAGSVMKSTHGLQTRAVDSLKTDSGKTASAITGTLKTDLMKTDLAITGTLKTDLMKTDSAKTGTLKTESPVWRTEEVVKVWELCPSASTAGEVREDVEGWDPAPIPGAATVGHQAAEQLRERRGKGEVVSWGGDEASEVATVLSPSPYHCHVIRCKQQAEHCNSRERSKFAGHSDSRQNSKQKAGHRHCNSIEHSKFAGHSDIREHKRKQRAGRCDSDSREQAGCCDADGEDWQLRHARCVGGCGDASCRLPPGRKQTHTTTPRPLSPGPLVAPDPPSLASSAHAPHSASLQSAGVPLYKTLLEENTSAPLYETPLAEKTDSVITAESETVRDDCNKSEATALSMTGAAEFGAEPATTTTCGLVSLADIGADGKHSGPVSRMEDDTDRTTDRTIYGPTSITLDSDANRTAYGAMSVADRDRTAYGAMSVADSDTDRTAYGAMSVADRDRTAYGAMSVADSDTDRTAYGAMSVADRDRTAYGAMSVADSDTDRTAYGAMSVADRDRTAYGAMSVADSDTDRTAYGAMSVADRDRTAYGTMSVADSDRDRTTYEPVSLTLDRDEDRTMYGPTSILDSVGDRAKHCIPVIMSSTDDDDDDDGDDTDCSESSRDSSGSSSSSETSPRRCGVASARLFHCRRLQCAAPTASPPPHAPTHDPQTSSGQQVTRAPRPARDHVTINDLPSVLLVQIFSFLPTVTRLGCLSLVCRKWQVAAFDPDLWRRLDLRNLPRLTDDWLLRLASLSDRVASLVLSDGRPMLLTDKGVSRVMRQCQYLTKIKLNRCFFLSDDTFESVGHHCHSVVCLNFSGCFSLTDRTLLAISEGCPLLEELDLGQCARITDKGVCAVARGCPRLIAFRVDQCGKLTNGAVEALANHCPDLQVLHLLSCALTDAGIEHLSKLRKLQVLDLSNLSELSRRVVEGVVQCCPLLETLALSLNRRVDDHCVRRVVSSCPKLRCLSCVACGLSDLGLQFIASQAKQLERLDVAWCADITDEGVSQVTAACPRLRYMGLMRCPLVTMATVERLVHQHPHIYFSNFELETRRLVRRACLPGPTSPRSPSPTLITQSTSSPSCSSSSL